MFLCCKNVVDKHKIILRYFSVTFSLPYTLHAIEDLNDEKIDGVILVASSVEYLDGPLEPLKDAVEAYIKVNKAAAKEASVVTCPGIAASRLIYAPTGPLNRDYDDVRRFQDAGTNGIKLALAAGCKAPLVVVQASMKHVLSVRVATLAVLTGLYTALEVREASPEKAAKVDRVGVWTDPTDRDAMATIMFFTNTVLASMASAHQVYADIAGSDPERMAPPRVAEYVENIFKDTCVKVRVVSDPETLSKEYPLLMAVNRATKAIDRQTARVIHLEYFDPDHPVDTTLMFVGKGVTYDTGGADVKYGGAMAGMHRDKCGAAFVAGLFKLLAHWKPRGLKVIGAMSMVRNSIGSDAYVSDELFTSRAGVRVRIGNTDAEGRMAMADVLCEMKEKALNEKNPALFTVATLTGHVIRCYGENYGAMVANGPAQKAGLVNRLLGASEVSGDPLEHSKLRREDFEFHAGKSECEDIIQSGGKPSTMTDRGHQSPAAFLIMASGLDKHGLDSANMLPFCHLDIAGSAGQPPKHPTGSPLVAFAHAFVLNRESPSTAVPEEQEHLLYNVVA
ncbi:hypothetical protein NP493_296g02047 [Ridgeia piscesae]|uniref:Cytosol aminopeptidase domain-containing protein n=1 Tax=Ridgeia piscesae TaxID=27915 RepID=A0AAD9NWJ0_RIDPI|nr:hypothetical protein NP493_296g02047 [Ridgeia piscesae]